jgi:hypothetical protein
MDLILFRFVFKRTLVSKREKDSYSKNYRMKILLIFAILILSTMTILNASRQVRNNLKDDEAETFRSNKFKIENVLDHFV